MHIGIIAARAGSKRLPGKNRLLFDGKELWYRTVEKSLKTMDRTIVNTDDDLIITDNICERYERPEHLRDGISYPFDDTIIEMCQSLRFENRDIVHVLLCTNPFIDIEKIKLSKDLLVSRRIDSVQFVNKVKGPFHAYSQFVVDRDGYAKFAYPDERKTYYYSQKQPSHFTFGGYLGCRVGSLLRYKSLWGERTIDIGVSFCEAFHIDSLEDFRVASTINNIVSEFIYRPAIII